MPKKIHEWVLSAVVFLMMAYAWITFLGFVPYFNWQYAKKNGFVKWLFFGEIVPTAKAIVWPYFVFLTSLMKII